MGKHAYGKGKSLTDGARVDRNIFARVSADGRITAFQVKIAPPGGGRAIIERFESIDEARSYRDSVRADLALEPYRERVLRAREVARAKRHIASVTLKDLLTMYGAEVTPGKRGQYTERYMIEVFKSYAICKLPAVALTITSVRGLVQDLSNNPTRPRSRTTISKYLSLLSAVLTWAKKKLDHPIPNPVRDLPAEERRTNGAPLDRRLHPEEERYLRLALANSSNPYLLPLFDLALETAARQGELLSMRWADIDLQNRIAIARQTKNGSDRPILLSTRAITVLQQLQALSPTDLSGTITRMTKTNINQRWRSAKEKALRLYLLDCKEHGRTPAKDFLQHLRWHSLRHEAISRRGEDGTYESMLHLQIYAGHKDSRMTERYLHIKNFRQLASMLN